MGTMRIMIGKGIKRKNDNPRKKENKENEWKCVECETKCNSLETILKHIHKMSARMAML